MALVTTVASPSAESYVTVAEADAYWTQRELDNPGVWFEAAETDKERRLRLAAMMLDSLPLRGIRATTSQALAFPRLFPGDDLWPTSGIGEVTDDPAYRYREWAEVEALAEALGISPPGVPRVVKEAQMEIAVLYASHLYSLDPTNGEAFGAVQVAYVQSGDFAISTRKSSPAYDGAGLWPRELLTPGSIVYYLMKPYLAKIRGFAL